MKVFYLSLLSLLLACLAGCGKSRQTVNDNQSPSNDSTPTISQAQGKPPVTIGIMANEVGSPKLTEIDEAIKVNDKNIVETLAEGRLGKLPPAKTNEKLKAFNETSPKLIEDRKKEILSISEHYTTWSYCKYLYEKNPLNFEEKFKRVRIVGKIAHIGIRDGYYTLSWDFLFDGKPQIYTQVKDTEENRNLIKQIETNKTIAVIDCERFDEWKGYGNGKIVAFVKDIKEAINLP